MAAMAISCTSLAGAWSTTGTSGFRHGPSVLRGPTCRRDAIDIIDDDPQCEVETSAVRRRLLLSTMAIAVATVSLDGPADAVGIEEDYTKQVDAVPATPSVVEGELTVSQPPPNRIVNVSDKRPDQKKKANRSGYFVAGGASAAFSHGITVPIDVVKTKSQTDDALAGLSPLDAALRIVEDEGAGALSKGLQPTVLGYGFEGAMKFGVYESLKPLFLVQFAGQSNEAYLAAAVCAGALASIILCPLEETRIRLVTDSSFANGLTDGLPKLLRENGIASPFRKGLAPMLSKQVPYTIGKQVSFDLFASVLYSFLSGLSFVPRGQIAIEVEVGAAFLASIVACLLSQPGDVVLTQTYKNDSSDEGFLSTISSLYGDGGVGRFFRGLSARFLHVGCIITFQLVIYDQLKQALGLPASGS